MMSVPKSSRSSAIAQRLARLDALLAAHENLWRPQAYKLEPLGWCERHPQLGADLLHLRDDEVVRLLADAPALIDFIARAEPGVAGLAALVELPVAESHELPPPGPHAMRDVPGRKAAQIERFVAAIGRPRAPLVEWCAGKGHLGRRLALACDTPVTSLEIDTRLCEAGRVLARRDRVESQRFVGVDVLSPFVRGQLRARHAVALHACGDLHRVLLQRAVEEGAAAVHLAPCCHHKVAEPAQAGLSREGCLALSRDDLRLAVSDAVTAAPREIQAGRLEASWTLGLRAMVGQDRLSMRVPDLRPVENLRCGSFRRFCEQSAAQAGIAIDTDIDWAKAERDAHVFEQRVRRLALPRFAFRRAIELWLAFDRARFLEQHGYRVSVSRFCSRDLTPRNILITAQR